MQSTLIPCVFYSQSEQGLKAHSHSIYLTHAYAADSWVAAEIENFLIFALQPHLSNAACVNHR